MKHEIYQYEKSCFIAAVNEVAVFLQERGDLGDELSKRHFRFENDRYFIESKERLSFDKGISDAFFRKPEELDLDLPALNNCLKVLAPYFEKAHTDLDREGQVDFGYWQAWIRLRPWIGQCFSSAACNSPNEKVAEAVFEERFSMLLDAVDSRLGKFIVPIHGVTWDCSQDAITMAEGLSLVRLADEVKSEGWYDYWFDHASTNPRDIAYCEVAAIGASQEARASLELLLDCLRLVGVRRIKAPDCFWLGHEFSMSPAGYGGVENYDSISRPIVEKVALDIDTLLAVRGLLGKIERVRSARNDGAIETPIRRYVLACNRRSDPDRLMDLALSMESLFSASNAWLQALSILAPYISPAEATSLKAVLSRLKKARDAVAHTGVYEMGAHDAKFMDEAFTAVSDVICAVIDKMANSNSTVKEVVGRGVDSLLAKGISIAPEDVARKWWRRKGDGVDCPAFHRQVVRIQT
jgi:hypothetical protein